MGSQGGLCNVCAGLLRCWPLHLSKRRFALPPCTALGGATSVHSRVAGGMVSWSRMSPSRPGRDGMQQRASAHPGKAGRACQRTNDLRAAQLGRRKLHTSILLTFNPSFTRPAQRAVVCSTCLGNLSVRGLSGTGVAAWAFWLPATFCPLGHGSGGPALDGRGAIRPPQRTHRRRRRMARATRHRRPWPQPDPQGHGGYWHHFHPGRERKRATRAIDSPQRGSGCLDKPGNRPRPLQQRRSQNHRGHGCHLDRSRQWPARRLRCCPAGHCRLRSR